MQNKKCITCYETKPLTDFYRHAESRGGQPEKYCKLCHNKKAKARRLEHRKDPAFVEKEKAAGARRRKLHAHEIVKDMRVWRKSHKAEIRAFSRKYYNKNKPKIAARGKILRQERAVSIKKYTRKYREENPQKYHCHWLAREALKASKIKKSACYVCGEKKSEAHHDDYTKPLDVKWLCRKHHLGWHRVFLVEN